MMMNHLLSSDDAQLPAAVGSNEVGSSFGHGHHTTVAYNPLSGDGSYVWWRQNSTNTKAIYVHGPDGTLLPAPLPFSTNLSSADPPATDTPYTIPLAQTYSSAVPYVFWMPSGLYGLKSDKTWTLLDETRSLGCPLAVRSLQTETVGLMGSNAGALNLVTSDYPGRPVLVATSSGGMVDLFYTGAATEDLRNSWQTSWSGAGTFASGYPIAGAHAKQIAVGVNADGRQEVFYVGQDDVLRHARERQAGGDSFEDLGAVAGSTARAKQIAVKANDDGKLSLFFTRYPDNVLCFTRQTEQNGPSWTAPSPLAGATTKARRIAVASASEGKLQLVFTGMDDVLQNTWQTAASSDTWSAPTLVGSSTTTALEIVLIAEAGQPLPEILYVTPALPPLGSWLAEAKQTALGNWTTALVSAGGPKQIAASLNQSSNLHVVFVGPDDALYQMIKHPSGWSGVSSLVSPAPKAKRVSVTR